MSDANNTHLASVRKSGIITMWRFATERERVMEIQNKNYQDSFNSMLRDVSEMIEITGNEVLKRLVKKRLFEFSEEIEGEIVNAIPYNKKNNY